MIEQSTVLEQSHGTALKYAGLRDSARNLLAGFTAGAICKVAEYPLDTVKVLLQSHPTRYSGPIDCLRTTYRTNGVAGLYKGVTTPVVGAMLETATLFVSYGIMKRLLDVNPNPSLDNQNPMWKYLVSGGFSGFCTAHVLTPVELVKCNLQVQNTLSLAVVPASYPGSSSVALNTLIGSSNKDVTRYKGPIDVIIRTVKAKGLAGLYKGNISCLFREIPGNIAWFGMYEFVKTRVMQPLLKCENLSDLPLQYTMIAGSLAGISYWLLPYPADTVKSQIQTKQRFNGQGFFTVLKTIYREEGIKGLYKGCGVTVSRAAVSHAGLFYIYEVVYRYLAVVI